MSRSAEPSKRQTKHCEEVQISRLESPEKPDDGRLKSGSRAPPPKEIKCHNRVMHPQAQPI
eukprot:6173610-Pleurochrysis_carterae.AAC.1